MSSTTWWSRFGSRGDLQAEAAVALGGRFGDIAHTEITALAVELRGRWIHFGRKRARDGLRPDDGVGDTATTDRAVRRRA